LQGDHGRGSDSGGRPPPLWEHCPGRPGSFERSAVMAWIMLIVAGFFEVVWAYSMKLSDGFSRLVPSVFTLVMMMASFGLLSVSMRTLPLGTAYMVWTGIGAIGAFIVGIVALGEQLSLLRVLAAVLIVCGLVLMKLTSH
jgi:quaternary ammonium compound-resistance protein SugE